MKRSLDRASDVAHQSRERTKTGRTRSLGTIARSDGRDELVYPDVLLADDSRAARDKSTAAAEALSVTAALKASEVMFGSNVVRRFAFFGFCAEALNSFHRLAFVLGHNFSARAVTLQA